MTTNEAKKIIKAELARLQLPDYKLTAKSISFSDLARDVRIYVIIHKWAPHPAYKTLKEVAFQNGFCIDYKA